MGSFAAVWISKAFFHFNEGVTLFLVVLFNTSSLLLGHKLLRFAQRTDLSTPPLNAEYLFYVFMTAENCDAIVGDLEERYQLIHKKFGPGKANFWYWTQAIRSVGPIAWAWMRKVVMKPMVGVIAWAVAKGLLSHDSWLAMVVEMWKNIRS
jgi:hypothetical protein